MSTMPSTTSHQSSQREPTGMDPESIRRVKKSPAQFFTCCNVAPSHFSTLSPPPFLNFPLFVLENERTDLGYAKVGRRLSLSVSLVLSAEHVPLSHRQVAISHSLLISHSILTNLILTVFRLFNTKTETESLFLDSDCRATRPAMREARGLLTTS